MQKLISSFTAALAILACGCVSAVAQDFKPYPGSKLDGKAGREASAVTSGTECQVFTTSDGFDKIYAYYKGLYNEPARLIPAPKLPSGKSVQWAFFILDGAKDLSHAKYWMKIQRPYIGSIANGDGLDFRDIRDISVIQTVRKN